MRSRLWASFPTYAAFTTSSPGSAFSRLKLIWCTYGAVISDAGTVNRPIGKLNFAVPGV